MSCDSRFHVLSLCKLLSFKKYNVAATVLGNILMWLSNTRGVQKKQKERYPRLAHVGHVVDNIADGHVFLRAGPC